MRAFLYFLNLVDESVIQFAEVQGGRDADVPWAESLYQIRVITNEILPALIEAALTSAAGSPQAIDQVEM